MYNAWTNMLTVPYELKRKGWAKALPKLRLVIEDNKAGERHKALMERRKRRYNRMNQLYSELVHSACFPPFAYLAPTVDDLLLFPPFKALLEDDSKYDIEFEDWEKVTPSVPRIIQEYAIGLLVAANSAVVAILEEMKSAQETGNSKFSFDVTSVIPNSDNMTPLEATEESMLGYMAFSLFTSNRASLYHPLPFVEGLISARKSTGNKYNDPWLDGFVGIAGGNLLQRLRHARPRSLERGRTTSPS